MADSLSLHARASNEPRLLQLMLFLNDFSPSELIAATLSWGETRPARQTVRNLVSSLKTLGYLEVVQQVVEGPGRPREQLRVTTEPVRRGQFYLRAYADAPAEHVAIEPLKSESFVRALRLKDEAQIKLAAASVLPGSREEAKVLLQEARDYLELAFYELPLVVRNGVHGGTIREIRQEVDALSANAKSSVARARTQLWKRKLASNLRNQLTTHRWCELLLDIGDSFLPASTVSSVLALANQMDEAVAADWSALERARYACALMSEFVAPARYRNIIGEVYGELDRGSSFESSYGRACVQLMLSNDSIASNEWANVRRLAETDFQHGSVWELIKARAAKQSPPQLDFWIGIVDNNNLPTVWRIVSGGGAELVAAASMDADLLAWTTGQSSAVALRDSIPTPTGQYGDGIDEAPVFIPRAMAQHHGRRNLYMTESVSSCFDVPGPVQLKLAVGFQMMGLQGEMALKCGIDIVAGGKSVIFARIARTFSVSDVFERHALRELDVQWFGHGDRPASLGR
jgi:hypothetical protein